MSLQPTKIIGAVLAVAVVAFAIDFVSNQIFAKQELKVPGYVVEVTEPVAEAAPAAPEASSTAAAAPAAETPPATEAAPAEVTAAPTAAEPLSSRLRATLEAMRERKRAPSRDRNSPETRGCDRAGGC